MTTGALRTKDCTLRLHRFRNQGPEERERPDKGPWEGHAVLPAGPSWEADGSLALAASPWCAAAWPWASSSACSCRVLTHGLRRTQSRELSGFTFLCVQLLGAIIPGLRDGSGRRGHLLLQTDAKLLRGQGRPWRGRLDRRGRPAFVPGAELLIVPVTRREGGHTLRGTPRTMGGQLWVPRGDQLFPNGCTICSHSGEPCLCLSYTHTALKTPTAWSLCKSQEVWSNQGKWGRGETALAGSGALPLPRSWDTAPVPTVTLVLPPPLGLGSPAPIWGVVMSWLASPTTSQICVPGVLLWGPWATLLTSSPLTHRTCALDAPRGPRLSLRCRHFARQGGHQIALGHQI